MGDGEMDEPESLGAISLAGREHLDNLIFVVNCNLQRLDGPVRGNGKIIQELETDFRGAGWNVIKVIWGSRWDPLLADDTDGLLRAAHGGGRRRRLPDLQVARRRLRARALLRHVPRARASASRDLTDDEIWALNRGGHDPQQGLRRLRRGDAPQGPADRDPRQDDQGLRDGRGRRGPEHHPPAEEDERGRAARLPRPLRPAAHRRARSTTCAFYKPPEDAPEMQLPARAPRRARRLAARAPHARRTRCRRPALEPFKGAARRHRRPRDLDDDGVRADPRRAAARQGARPARRADRPRRVAHLRHGGHVPPARDLQPGRPALRARGRRPADVLPRGQGTARSSRRASTSRARFSSWIAAATSYSNHGDPDDPVLHLLLDVRLPADRRSGLGRRRLARARLPARRHRRAHDAERRGPPARGRPLHICRPR